MKCGENRLRIRKMKMVNGTVQMPNQKEEFVIRVESCFCRQYFRLNEYNHFCVELDRLRNETICVYEDEGKDVIYCIDGENYEEACVDFTTASFYEVIVLNHEEDFEKGTLRIKKEVIAECEDAYSDTSFSFVMTGDNFTRNILLNEANNYTTEVKDIPYGNYRVEEVNHENYDVTYVVDGIESDIGTIEITNAYGEMLIYNRRNDIPHILRISKWIKDGTKLKKPMYPNSYEIRLDDGMAVREYTLNCNNHFNVEVRGYARDYFVLEELAVGNVIYELDGEIVESVQVKMDQDHDLRIINEKSEEKGSIIIQKWIEEEGRLVLPDASMSFEVSIYGYDEHSYTLDYANDFTIVLDNVSEGYYRVEEKRNEDFEVYYEINGEREEDGYIQVHNGDVTSVSIINVRKENENNELHFFKRNNVGANEYVLRVESDSDVQYVILNEKNNYETNMFVGNGWYRIYEEEPENGVRYRLDGVDHGSRLVFYVNDSNHDIEVLDKKGLVNYVL